jgi:agmatine deiminase
MRSTGGILFLLAVGLVVGSALAQESGTPGITPEEQELVPPPLPRWREGGTPYDENQRLEPYAARRERDMPTSGLIASPPEYSPTRGVVFAYISSQWASVVRDLVVALTNDPNCPTCDEIAYVVVTSASQQQTATTQFQAGGADMSKVQFFIHPMNALWIRDYGPHFIWQNGALGIVDSHYYPERPLDNFVPTRLGDDSFLMPTYDMGLYYSGGNLQPGPDRMAVMSSLINLDNPTSEGFTPSLIAELFSKYQGIDTLHIFPMLPTSVDGTGHIDMWMYLVDEDTVIISEYIPGSNATAIQITNNAVTYMQNLGFTVYRTPAWNAVQSGYMTNYTYTNAFRVNNRVFVPTYGDGNSAYRPYDNQAIAAWIAAAGPEVEIYPINAYPIIYAAGAFHCIVMQMPRYTDAVPAAHVIWPDGGQLLVAGTTRDILWVATDTDNVTIPQVDLYYTVNDGATWVYIGTTTNTGSYPWTVPNLAAPQAKIKVVVTAADNDQAEAVSEDYFQIAKADQTIYTFASGGGVDKFGWGYQTASWNNVNGVRRPVNAAIPSSAYPKLAASDATGGDGDTNRYVATTPSNGYESTHVYEFYVVETPDAIDDIQILWEGYAGQCTQVELYVWDYVQGQWSDATGTAPENYGINRYADNWAGTRDGILTADIRTNFERYVNASGQVTFLIYAERGSASGYAKTTYHDYVAVTVTQITQSLAGDVNCDGVVNFGDINPFIMTLTDPEGWQTLYPECHLLNADANGNGSVSFDDINPFIALLTG